MDFIKRIFTFPKPFLRVFPPVWLGGLVVLVGLDLASKKIVTDTLNFPVLYGEQLVRAGFRSDGFPAQKNGTPRIPLFGKKTIPSDSPEAQSSQPEGLAFSESDGRYVSFELVFNDRYVFGIGPSMPVLSLLLTLVATTVLVLYRWHYPMVGHALAWLLVFSGAVGNLIDKLFVKSLTTREWVFSLTPREGHVSGVVDFVKCIWFGWNTTDGIPVLQFLAWPYWPTFNLADSLIVVGIVVLFLSTREAKSSEKDESESESRETASSQD